jgi:hypothetical protein
VTAILTNRFKYIVQGQILLPLVPVDGVVTWTGAIQTQKSGKTVRAQFTLEYSKGMPLELLVRQLIDGDLILAP